MVAGAELMRTNARRVLAAERRALVDADVVLAVGPELAARWEEAFPWPRAAPGYEVFG